MAAEVNGRVAHTEFLGAPDIEEGVVGVSEELASFLGFKLVGARMPIAVRLKREWDDAKEAEDSVPAESVFALGLGKVKPRSVSKGSV